MSERSMALMTPMWQRIARGEVDLDEYTDDEILTGRITMADGRLLPAPVVLPDRFIAEQVRRGFRKAERQVREGAMESLDVMLDILKDDTVAPKDRISVGKFFTERFLGPAEQRLHVTYEGDTDPRELLIQKLMAAKAPPEDEDVYDVEVVDELEELL